MISEHKSLLRGMEVLAGASALTGFGCGLSVLSRAVDPKVFEPTVFYSFALMFAVFATAVCVAAEYAQTIRTEGSWWQRAGGLSLAEMKGLVHWCPRRVLYLSMTGAATGFAIGLSIGEVHWSPGQPFTDREAIGFTAGLSTFCFLSWPILSSASRMPGAFRVHYGT